MQALPWFMQVVPVREDQHVAVLACQDRMLRAVHNSQAAHEVRWACAVLWCLSCPWQQRQGSPSGVHLPACVDTVCVCVLPFTCSYRCEETRHLKASQGTIPGC